MSSYEKIADKYRMIYDHHTHTIYSHGKGTIEDHVKVASSKGLESIAITDHGPGHLTYGIKMSDIPKMKEEKKRLSIIYPDVKVLLGVEANTIRVAPYIDVDEEQKKEFDILLAGYHFGILKSRNDFKLYKFTHRSHGRSVIYVAGKKHRHDSQRTL